jgi:hypothetical protein
MTITFKPEADGNVSINCSVSEARRIISLMCYVNGDVSINKALQELNEHPVLDPDSCLGFYDQKVSSVFVDDDGNLKVFCELEYISDVPAQVL